MRARVFRVLAILFLVYTGLDITVPQLCCGEFSYPGIIQVSAASDLSDYAKTFPAIDAAKNSSGDPTSGEQPQDEDCFCCCTHVLPGRAIAVIATPELKAPFASLQKISLASPPLQSPYHPPRSA